MKSDFARNLTLLLCSTMIIMAGTAINPVLPELKDYFKGTPNVDLWVRLVLTLPGLFIAVGSPLGGYLLDRYGRRPVLLASVFLMTAAGTAGLYLETMTSLLISRAFVGLAVAGIMAGCTALFADYYSGHELNKYMGLQAAIVGFGGVLFLLLGGWLAEYGWRTPFWIFSLGALVLPAIYFFVEEPPFAASVTTGYGYQFVFRHKKEIFLINTIALVGMILFFIKPVQIPFFLREVGLTSNMQTGLILASLTLVASIGSTQYHRIKHLVSFRTMTFGMFLFMSAGFAIVYFSQGPLGILLGMVFTGLGMSFYLPSLNVLTVSTVSPDEKGRALGILNSSIFMGQFLSPIVCQPIIQNVGLRANFGLAALALLTLALLTKYLKPFQK